MSRSVRWLWKEEATEAVLEHLEDTRVDEGRDEEGGPGPP